MHEQRAADAPVAASDGEPGIAGPEASVLELPRVSRGEAVPSLPVRTAWAGAAQLPVLGSARDAANTRGRGLTSKSVKFQTYDLGRSPLRSAGRLAYFKPLRKLRREIVPSITSRPARSSGSSTGS